MAKKIPWCECTLFDVGYDVDLYAKLEKRKKEIVLASSLTSPALIKCINDEGLHRTTRRDVIEMEFDRQYQLVKKQKQFNYADYIKFDKLIHDMSFLKEK